MDQETQLNALFFEQKIRDMRKEFQADYERIIHEIRNEFQIDFELKVHETRNEFKTDFDQKLQQVRIELQADFEQKIQENRMKSHDEMKENEQHLVDENSSVYSTHGYFMHAVALTACPNATRKKSWVAAIGSLFVMVLQLLILQMTIFDANTRVLNKDAEDVCGQLVVRRSVVFIFLSILYSCVLYDDIKESKVEEVVLDHAVENNHINYPICIELIRIGLRFRRFILPWKLTQTAVFMIIQEDELSSNEIVLNFLSVAFIGETDGLLGRILCTAGDHTRADQLVEKARKDKVKVSFMWVKISAAMPTLMISIASVAILRLEHCAKHMFKFSIFAVNIMPLIMILCHSIIKFVKDEKSIADRLKHIEVLEDLTMNLLAYCIFVIITILPFPEGLQNTQVVFFFAGYWLNVLILGCFRRQYTRINSTGYIPDGVLFYGLWYICVLTALCFMMASAYLLFFPFFLSLKRLMEISD